MNSVFDLEEALQRVEGDRAFLDELARIYLDEVANLMETIAIALEKNDVISAANAAHTIKGASANFCAQAVYDAAWALEQMRLSNSEDEIRRAYADLLRETERLNQALRQEFSILDG